MTIKGFLLFLFLAAMTIVIAWLVGIAVDEKHSATIGAIIGVIISVFILIGMLFYYNCTESGKRAYKTQESNLDGGITREVIVYDMNGDIIKEYRGKFDIEYDDDRILFDDENGRRHIIYYPTGTVIIDEID